MTTRAGSRGKRSIALMKEVPTGLADKWDLLVDVTANNLLEMRRKLKKAIGERPYKGFPVTEEDRGARWSQIRQDVPALVEMLRANSKHTPDGEVLVPKALIDSMTEQETRRRKGGLE